MYWIALLLTVLAVLSPFAAQATPTQMMLLNLDCQNGDEDACDALLLSGQTFGGYFTAPHEPQSVADHLTALRPDCDAGNMKACGILGDLVLLQNPMDNPEGYALLARACDGGEALACARLAYLTQLLPYSVGPNYISFYEEQAEVCATGNPSACTTQARLNALLPDVLPDEEIWRGQLETACDADLGRACVILSYMLSEDGLWEYKQLDPGLEASSRSNARRALSYARKACDLGNPVGCWNAGLAYDDGNGARTDWERAQHHYVLACQGGYDPGCEEINYESFWRASDPLRTLESACGRGDFSACHLASEKRHAPISITDMSDADRERMTRYSSEMTEICEMGSLRACSVAGSLFRGLGRLEEAERYAAAACALGDQHGCLAAGNIWKLDRTDPGHHEQAIGYYQMACDLENWAACNNLGDSYRRGLGVEANTGRATRLFTLACTNGLALGCRNAANLIGETDIDKALPFRERACELHPPYCSEWD
ncbi:tetratricopeptide repeat protein [Aestuariibius sp. 2305UL40-4]|uniref:tetratricopeptide repeat protein n=1 Tax=Aestuariibius violaceus TaxID=3234132 RepID=UPI00345EC41E